MGIIIPHMPETKFLQVTSDFTVSFYGRRIFCGNVPVFNGNQCKALTLKKFKIVVLRICHL